MGYIDLFGSDFDVVSHVISMLSQGDTDTIAVVLQMLSTIEKEGTC